MRIAVATVAYREARLLPKFLDHIPDWVETKLVLASTEPWQGEPVPDDGTIQLAEAHGTQVIAFNWPTEEAQRNAGQEYLSDYDYIIWLDPDEFLDRNGWDTLKQVTAKSAMMPEAYIVEGQYTYWKSGYVADPPHDYPQLILVTPEVRFVDKRVVDRGYAVLPLWIHHFSWARTDEEVWTKISHYAHAKDFDIQKWYDEVWLPWKPGVQDVHPLSPVTLHELIPTKLPVELDTLELWPVSAT